jgi:hypothetical protein
MLHRHPFRRMGLEGPKEFWATGHPPMWLEDFSPARARATLTE